MNSPSFRKPLLITAILAAVSVVASGPVALAGRDKQSLSKADEKAREAAAIRSAVARRELMPLPRILTLAQAAVPGEVIKVEVEYEQGVVIYEIKILAGNGRVREVKLNARTGALIEVEDD